MNILRIYNLSVLFTLLSGLALYSATGDTDPRKYAGLGSAFLSVNTIVGYLYAAGGDR